MQRRTLISGLAALFPALSAKTLFANTPRDEDAPTKSCRLTTRDVSGPFDIGRNEMRSDVRDTQQGVPLRLDFQVWDAFGCAPLPGALVTIWHANPDGVYSGVNNVMLTADMKPEEEQIDMRSESFLRGMQKTDDKGWVRFNTIFPGWYYPRPAHLHVRVNPPNFGEEAVTQLYFPNDICDEVYASEHYAHRGPCPQRPEPGVDDPIFASEAHDLWLDLRKTGDGYAARHELGVIFYGGMFGDLPDAYRQ